MKPILAFDTSTAICAAALIHDGEIIGESHEDLKRGQAERLFPLIEDLLQNQGLEWSGLAGLAVGIGPGNFTGIRISVSAARGLALALQVPAVGVSTFEMVMYHNAEKVADEKLVIASVSAPQGSAYVQKFAGQLPAGAPHQIYPDKPPTAEISQASLVIGENAEMVAEVFGCRWYQTTGVKLPAVAIAQIAEARLTNLSYQHTPPAPLYVRAPDAAPARDKAPVILL